MKRVAFFPFLTEKMQRISFFVSGRHSVMSGLTVGFAVTVRLTGREGR